MATGTIMATIEATKEASTSISATANEVATVTLTVNDSHYHLIKGFAITASSNLAIVQCYFSTDTTITVRVRNLMNATTTGNVTVQYC